MGASWGKGDHRDVDFVRDANPKSEPLLCIDYLRRLSNNGSMTHQANYTLALLRCLRVYAEDIRRQLHSLDAFLAMPQGDGDRSVDRKRRRGDVPCKDRG